MLSTDVLRLIPNKRGEIKRLPCPGGRVSSRKAKPVGLAESSRKIRVVEYRQPVCNLIMEDSLVK